MTKTETRILQTLWDSEKPMCAGDILEANSDLKDITVRTALKSMLEKEMIKVDGITQRTKTFARTFVANVTPEQVYCNELKKTSNITPFKFACALLKGDGFSEDELDALKSIIEERSKKQT